MNRHGLLLKFNLLITGTVFLCGILMCGMFLETMMSYLEQALDRSGEDTAMALGVVISQDILYDDQLSIYERLMQTLEKNSQVRYIILLSPDGQILQHTFSGGWPQGLPEELPQGKGEKVSIVSFASNEGRIREVCYPLDKGALGYLRLGMMEQDMAAVIQYHCRWLIGLVFIICLSASLLASHYACMFLRPIKKISRVVKSFGNGIYDLVEETGNMDETDDLAHSFNEMARRLKKQDARNKQLMDRLLEKEISRQWLIGRIFSARENERERISRELHDEAGQSMASILAYLRVLHDKLTTKKQRELLFSVRDLAVHTLDNMRCLARDLHPPLLDDLGLLAAMEKYIISFRKANPGMEVYFSRQGDFSGLTRLVSLVCYRILQEAMTNITRHAQAQHIDISISCLHGEVMLKVLDDGIGFSSEEAEQARLDRHLGLVSMQERVSLLCGKLYIDSTPGSGTKLVLVIPALQADNDRRQGLDV